MYFEDLPVIQNNDVNQYLNKESVTEPGYYLQVAWQSTPETFVPLYTKSQTEPKIIEEIIQNKRKIVHADNDEEAVRKIFNNNLNRGIYNAFTLSDESEKATPESMPYKTINWKTLAEEENSNRALIHLGNGYYASRYEPADGKNDIFYNDSDRIIRKINGPKQELEKKPRLKR